MATYGYGTSPTGKPGTDHPSYYDTAPAPGTPVGGGYAAAPIAPLGVVDGIPLYPDHPDPTVRSKFVTQGYRDAWAAILFAVAVLVTFIAGIYNGVQIGKEDADGTVTIPPPPPGFTPAPTPVPTGVVKTHVSTLLKWYIPGAAAAAVGFACIAMGLMRAFARQYVWIANGMVIALNVIMALYVGAVYHQWITAVFWLLFAAINALWLFLVRKRIPFAGVLLSTSVTTVTRHWGTLVTSFGALLVGCVYVTVWCFMAIPTLNGINRSSGSAGLHYFASCVFLLLFLWTTQVIINVAHVTASGTVATWYFVGGGNMPTNPSMASLKRATTTSFGSICFGSLVVAILKLLYYMARSAARNSNSFAACVAACILGILERLLEYFNVYAFTYVAIYGFGYIDAAKKTWEMIKNCGFAAYFNDSLVWPVLTLTTFFGSLAIGLAFGLASSSFVVGVVAFVVAFVIMTLLFRPVYSGIVTVFVCVAEAPDVMRTANPEFAAAMDEAERIAQEPVC